MDHLRSSAIWAVNYDTTARTLTIWFKEGAHPYDYYGVPPHRYQELLKAGSKGAYFNTHIRDQYAA
ncbi:KTSC domain-containing protein [Novosphingobium sp. SL115]|uniref:KTSC domain-containing protein n=1 Tax=Novosphingobium sp. SL115 TaxID=2995150 RepID=UPI003FA391F8